MNLLRLLSFLLILSAAPTMAESDPQLHPLLPGFSAEPLPIDLPNCNNVLYRHDGKLIALAYRGDVYVLSDTDGDGVEDHAELFWESKGRIAGQIGMDLAPKDSPHGNAVFIAAKGQVIMLADRDGDDRAEVFEVLAEGWPPARAGVDVTGLTLDPRDGSIWFGLGVRWYDNAYEIDSDGIAHNDLQSERGAIHRISPDFKTREKICTGIRWPIALRFNREGDLFCTDQEGATWLPNGNPFDELLHIQRDRHYGFPPRHPRHLPHVIDEPSVFDYGPQHQSTCGMAFNEPVNGGPVFGPSWWAGDALVTGESRGKIYRTKLVKTDVGYVAHNEIIASLNMLTIDLCVSPRGELRVATHSGPPDWGTGPEGPGQIWRITYDQETTMPQPVLTWRGQPNQVKIAFDRPLPNDWKPEDLRMHSGPNARAGNHFESMRPPYEVVKRQLVEGHHPVAVEEAQVLSDRHLVSIDTEALPEDTWVDFELSNQYALQSDSTGIVSEWEGEEESTSWMPHLDFEVSRALWSAAAQPPSWLNSQIAGSQTLRTQLDLWQMLQPHVQEGARLDYEYLPEMVNVTFSSTTSPFEVVASDAAPQASTQGQISNDLTLTFTVTENRPIALEIHYNHPAGVIPQFTAYWSTNKDPTHRAFPRRRFMMPWVTPAQPAKPLVAARPEIQGGDWARGKEVYFGAKAQCSMCHTLRGEGLHIGPDLSHLPYRDYASVWRDLVDPSAAINPDYPTQEITLTSGANLTAVPHEDSEGNVRLGVGPSAVVTIKKEEIETARPKAESLMPVGLETRLTDKERKDLMTFLLTEPPIMRDYASLPQDGVDHLPPARTRAELADVLEGAPDPAAAIRPLKIVLVAGPKDHGHGAHDYPRWQDVWSRLLALADKVEIHTAWEWPSRLQWEEADAIVFFKRGTWTPETTQHLNTFLQRGGGATFIHWACEADDHGEALAEQIGLASNNKVTRYRHGLIDVRFSKEPHAILRGFSETQFHDESYWALIGNPASIETLGVVQEEGEDRPVFWTRESEDHEGRVFVSIPGHYSWTFDDPLFRTLILRGIAWSAKEPIDRFNNLIEAGVIVKAENRAEGEN